MFLNGYSLEILRYNNLKGVHCSIHLEDDISDVLPFLNTRFGGFVYIEDPPSLTLKHYGKLLTFYPEKIVINALKDPQEAEKLADWLFREINETWDSRHEIQPSTCSAKQPTLIEVLKLLPKTNCRKCNEPTCMVFSTKVIEGVKNEKNCPEITPENKKSLKKYLSGFQFD